MHTKIRIIGDVHGKFYAYREKIKDVDYSIQLGDFGFAIEWNNLSEHKINFDNHKIIPGNHEDYYGIRDEYTFRKDYGMTSFHGLEFFFLRGAYSIDQQYRVMGKSWWPEEELSYKDLGMAVDLYIQTKPEIVFTHDCPKTVADKIFNPHTIYNNRTSKALDEMFYIHKPKLWIFGHWHKTILSEIDTTVFLCLDELDSIDYIIDKNVGNDVNYNIYLIKNQIMR